MSKVVDLPRASFSGKSEKPAPPRKPKNADVRSREHLTPGEVDQLMAAAGKLGRHSYRDKTLILVMYRHALRACVRTDRPTLGPGGPEGRTRPYQPAQERHPVHTSPRRHRDPGTAQAQARPQYVFVTERKGPMTDSNVRKMVTRAGKEAGIDFPVHPHMLRHGCGFKLANDGQDTRAIQHYLGHKNIQLTVRYTELAPGRFKDFWGD
jgi:type 1 fimbriae regulatory protein FimB/type 1 fimbriae regulatory protein FimE